MTTDDVLFVNQLKGVAVNDVVALERVLLLGSRAETVVGRPYVPGGVVLAAVEEHFRDGKVGACEGWEVEVGDGDGGWVRGLGGRWRWRSGMAGWDGAGAQVRMQAGMELMATNVVKLGLALPRQRAG